MKTCLNVAILLSVSLLLTSCGKDSGNNANPANDSSVIHGTIAGKEWTYRYGSAVHPAGSTVWVVSLSDKELNGDPCKVPNWNPGETFHYASFFVKELLVGELDYKMGSGKGSVSLGKTTTTATGVKSSSVGGFGTGKITEVTNENFRGTLDVRGDDENKISGSFFVKLCH